MKEPVENAKQNGGEEKPQENSKRKKLIAAIVALILLLLLGIGACTFLGDGWFDSDAEYGSYEGKTQEEIQADLNRIVEEGMMHISIANTIKFENGDRIGVARFENIEANHVDQKLTLTLADSGEVIYESGAIAPGQYIEKIEINRDLEPGMYDAVATFQGYDPETHKPSGGALAANIKLAVY